MRLRLTSIGLMALGAFLLVAAVVAFVRATGVPQQGEGRLVLWYPTGAAAGCAVYKRTYSCSSTPMGNINDDGRVVARSVPLMAPIGDFRWTVSPDQVEAGNRRRLARYVACVSAGDRTCREPVSLVPSWNSGMRTRWEPSFSGAYPLGVDPRDGFAASVLPWVLVVAGALVLAWGAFLFRVTPT